MSSIDHAVIRQLKDLQDGDRPTLVADLIAMYLEDASLKLAEMTEAIEQKNAATLRMRAHTLKGASTTVGARTMASLSLEVEMRSREGSLDEARALLHPLEMELQRVREGFEEILSGMNGSGQ